MIEVSVIDAGPLIHLDELNCLDLLEGLGSIYLPPEVKSEVVIHRPALMVENLPGVKISVPKSSPHVATYARTLDLDSGEIAALNLLTQLPGQLFLCDDAAARLAAESMGFKVHGTVGIILRATRRGKRTAAEAKQILTNIPTHSTLHLSRSLLNQVIESVPD